MTTLCFRHSAFAGHVTPAGHPEQVARLAAVDAGLAGLDLRFEDAPLAADAEVLRCHPQAYLDRLRAAAPASGFAQVDGDTYLSAGSLDAAFRAVGGACAAVDAVVAGTARNAFVAARPPGHHAETETAMGFCLFGTVAIAAKRALDHHGLSRLAIVDFDVHHGNGSQDLLWHETARAVLFQPSDAALSQGPAARARSARMGKSSICRCATAAGAGRCAQATRR